MKKKPKPVKAWANMNIKTGWLADDGPPYGVPALYPTKKWAYGNNKAGGDERFKLVRVTITVD